MLPVRRSSFGAIGTYPWQVAQRAGSELGFGSCRGSSLLVMVIAVALVGIVGCVVAGRGGISWISAVLALSGPIVWLSMDAIVSGTAASGPAGLSRGSWVAILRDLQWLAWGGVVATSAGLLLTTKKRGGE